MDFFAIAILVWLVMPVLFFLKWIRTRRRLEASLLEFERESTQKRGVEQENVDLKKKNEEFELSIKNLEKKYSPIISIEQEVQNLDQIIISTQSQIDELRREYSEKRGLLDRLIGQIAIYDERLSFAELGVYEPHFNFDDSERFKDEIRDVRDDQKEMISDKTATRCPTGWTVDGSRTKGQTMINRQTRLTMRAFNNECEAALANTRWNNVVAMEKRIRNAAKQINNSNSSMNLTITQEYVDLKIKELHLTHEYREKLKIEKEERLELARAEREEKKLLAEAAAAEREERKYQSMLDKARQEVGIDEGRIAELEAALQNAHSASERARAMAEMTKSGYVYIISNIGSFGEDIVKIGLTRRLDPNDRVRELGDASVPFGFDTHAMIYSEEAPALEAALHKEFADRRVNAANLRKEFFRVNLDEIEEAVRRRAPDASFFKDREAQEWHETLARRSQFLVVSERGNDEFPESI